MKNSQKPQKIDSEISPKKDNEEFLQNKKKKRGTTDLSVEALPKGKLRTKDSSTSEMVKSSTMSSSKAKREKQSGWLAVLILLYYTTLSQVFILKYKVMKEKYAMIFSCFDIKRQT